MCFTCYIALCIAVKETGSLYNEITLWSANHECRCQVYGPYIKINDYTIFILDFSNFFQFTIYLQYFTQGICLFPKLIMLF